MVSLWSFERGREVSGSLELEEEDSRVNHWKSTYVGLNGTCHAPGPFFVHNSTLGTHPEPNRKIITVLEAVSR